MASPPEGRRELRVLRAEALQEIRLQPDPVDLALAMSADLSEEALRGYIEDRIRVLSAQASQLQHQRERAWPDQTVADDLVVEHVRFRVQAELTGTNSCSTRSARSCPRARAQERRREHPAAALSG